MPRRELLTRAERESLLTVPVIEADQIRHYTLSRSDLAFIRQHRWDYNRLGVAIQLCYHRYPGRVLARGETPTAALLAMVATQLKSTPAQYQAAILAAGRDLMSQGVGRLDRASDAFEREQQNLTRVIGTVRGKRQQWEWLGITAVAALMVGLVLSPFAAGLLSFG